jgi:hypothetical protein
MMFWPRPANPKLSFSRNGSFSSKFMIFLPIVSSISGKLFLEKNDMLKYKERGTSMEKDIQTLIKQIAVVSAELVECIQWSETKFDCKATQMCAEKLNSLTNELIASLK